MYHKRVKIFVIVTSVLFLICLLRLVQMQLFTHLPVRDEIARLKLQRAKSLKTLRGSIFDCKGRILALDEGKFELHIDYRLSCAADERVQKAKILKAGKEETAETEVLEQIIEKCSHFGPEQSQLEEKIRQINNRVWNVRAFQAWRRNYLDPKIVEKYGNIISVPASVAIADFAKKDPNENHRLELIENVDDILEMAQTYKLLELNNDDDIFTAQLEFMDISGIHILPKVNRIYPYGSVASQIIGWVGPEQKKQLFTDDRLASYLEGELSGRKGVEYVCETILRGRRGEVIYDIDRKLVNRTETRLGKDISLTLDIELQRAIEEYLYDCQLNPNCKAPTAAVVIDVATGNILALVSMPVFDLNHIRIDYENIVKDPNSPLLNRAIKNHYPPGSVTKPVILIAGLESGEITPDEIINCPAEPAPEYWPNCWIYNQFRGGHDNHWPNNARNAIKGSCNIYFSRLANRISPDVLQGWLLKFGYGRKIPLAPAEIAEQVSKRSFQQVPGAISSTNPSSSNELPELKKRDRRWFGIGQGNFRVTALQVANAMATIARGGLYKTPRLFLNEDKSNSASVFLGILPETLKVVRDGMGAVVSEDGGTAYKEFAPFLDSLEQTGVKVYGKTGSTEKPEHAWFAGFGEDYKDRSIAVAVVVEGGQHGSRDAAPLARDIIQLCIEHGYIGVVESD